MGIKSYIKIFVNDGIEALKREVKEELGINIYDENIFLIGVYKSSSEKNKYFSYDYIIKVKYKIKEYKLQIEELSEVKDDDFYKQIEIIRKYSS